MLAASTVQLLRRAAQRKMTWATEPPGEDAEASVKSEVWRTAAAKLQEQGRDAEASQGALRQWLRPPSQTDSLKEASAAWDRGPEFP